MIILRGYADIGVAYMDIQVYILEYNKVAVPMKRMKVKTDRTKSGKNILCFRGGGEKKRSGRGERVLIREQVVFSFPLARVEKRGCKVYLSSIPT